MKVFEKFAAFIFLLLLIGMIAFLTFVPVPEESKQVILIIIGGLMTTAATSLPRMFGENDPEKEALRARVQRQGDEIRELRASYVVLKDNYDRLTEMLINRHMVPDGDGFDSGKLLSIEKKGE